ncbi:fungal-specific transcription factor domain-containing protein [Lipomyces oligophaga]|uniref:fungal-specific transcription factor domain-containing protein n=1 Tax=Lipomyces oligophaga TaxID=45792 RepID=UPI0034CD2229
MTGSGAKRSSSDAAKQSKSASHAVQDPSPAPSSSSMTNPSISVIPSRPVPLRKSRSGTTRIQLACEYCRRRKQKCDGAVPGCSTCVKMRRDCVYPDRLAYRQYPRGYVEGLEEKVRSYEAQIRSFQEHSLTDGEHTASTSPSVHSNNAEDDPVTESLITDIGYLSLEGSSERRYVGSSSGVYFARILKATFKHSDSFRAQNSPSPFEATLSSNSAIPDQPSSRHNLSQPASQKPLCISHLPDRQSALMLAKSFFESRWPQHPFLHRPTFFDVQFENTMRNVDVTVPSSDAFITLMVLAIGAIDMRKLQVSHEYAPLQYYQTAMEYHLDALIAQDDLQSIQGLILLTMFAINEPRSLNVWQAVGILIRMCVDFGLHREPSPLISLLQREIRKRTFWAAYIFDRSVSFALGRPISISDSDVNVSLPFNLTDDELYQLSESQDRMNFPKDEDSVFKVIATNNTSPSPLDMSAFLHIIQLRKINADIQMTFYATKPEQVATQIQDLEARRTALSKQLESWIASAPRYSLPTLSTFQSSEWFQIAYHNAQIILHRPSPVCPVVRPESLQYCYSSSISLIAAYASLYNQNRITYTWVALIGLFMASVTMLYTIRENADIRSLTTYAEVAQNIQTSMTLFRAMSEMWPIANRCLFIIESLGPRALQVMQQDSNSQSARVVGHSLGHASEHSLSGSTTPASLSGSAGSSSASTSTQTVSYFEPQRSTSLSSLHQPIVATPVHHGTDTSTINPNGHEQTRSSNSGKILSNQGSSALFNGLQLHQTGANTGRSILSTSMPTSSASVSISTPTATTNLASQYPGRMDRYIDGPLLYDQNENSQLLGGQRSSSHHSLINHINPSAPAPTSPSAILSRVHPGANDRGANDVHGINMTLSDQNLSPWISTDGRAEVSPAQFKREFGAEPLSTGAELYDMNSQSYGILDQLKMDGSSSFTSSHGTNLDSLGHGSNMSFQNDAPEFQQFGMFGGAGTNASGNNVDNAFSDPNATGALMDIGYLNNLFDIAS